MSKKQCFTLAILTNILTSLTAIPAARADFINDSHALLSLRNLYINTDYRDGAGAPSKTEEWAQGFLLKFESGYTDGPVGVGVDALGLLGVRLDSGKGRHAGGSMIPDDSDGSAVADWSSLGLAGKIRYSKSEARYGTVLPKLPILTSTDARLLPQTFEGLIATSNEIENLTLTSGWLDKATGRASTNRTGLSVLGPSSGNRESDGLFFAGADYNLGSGLTGQYYYSNLKDYYVQNYAGLIHLLALGETQSLRTEARYFRTRSDGANSTAAGRAAGFRVGGYTRDDSGEIDNDLWTVFSTYTYRAHSITLGYQSASDGSNFVQPNQNGLNEGAQGAALYLYTDRLIGQFNRAGEKTRYANYTYDFLFVGVPGLKASVYYLNGDQIKAVSGGDQKEWERDLLVDYAFQSPSLKGLAVGWRNIMLRTGAARDQDENRLVVSYTLPLM